MNSFAKWDIVYINKFPESIQCKNKDCREFFTLPNKYQCPTCKEDTVLINIISKARPYILWLDKNRWYASMTFGIPLSTSNIYESKFEVPIFLEQYLFLHNDKKENQPMRAVIHQATRIDGNTLQSNDLVGKIKMWF